jgi:signal transduction histidine kinase
MLSVLLVTSIGATGAILIYESASHTAVELEAKHLLLAENRAFALRDNFEILENELFRLAQRPQIDFGDNNPLPEAQLLELTHQNSVLYNTAVLLLSDDGECVYAVPESAGYRRQRFGDRPWFRAARAKPSGLQFYPTDEPVAGRTLKIVEPIIRKGRFTGALVGVIALGQDNLIAPALRDGLPPHTKGVLVDGDGGVVYPQDAYRAVPASGWAAAITAAARGVSGTLRASADGQDSLFAYAPVGAGTPYFVVFRWPWWPLVAELHHQLWALATVLLFGIVMAAATGLVFSAYLTRPLQALSTAAQRIARGEYRLGIGGSGAGRRDEIGALTQAFDHMGRSIAERDRALQEAAQFLEQRVEERTHELGRAQQALVEAERFAAMGKTSAAIAHELKNAMGGLGMAVDLILQDPQNAPRVARLRKQVVAEIARLRDVTDSLLSFSRAPRIERQPVAVAQLVDGAMEALADVIADRAADVRVLVDAPQPVQCDGHKIQSALVNLIKNAVEAGRRATVEARLCGGELVVDVCDDGPGLSEDARRHLFEPFFTTKPNGTGLGLPTSRRFIEAHGGVIEVDRAPSLGGARFRVRLPAAPATALAQAQGSGA